MFSLIKTIPKIWTKDKVQITIWTISSFLIASSWYAEPELPLFQDATQATVARMVRVLLTSSIFLLGLSASLSRTIYTIKKEQDPKPTPINKLSISKESISLLKILAENEPARVCPSEILTETMQYSRVKLELELLKRDFLVDDSICMGSDPICYFLTTRGRELMKHNKEI